ncbi:MAG: helicase C-terminal domain-containing protein [Planctomycetota bacterium]|nr:helicase C-terminal domain-containing protein [Planctomycetota bacterium]MDP6762079.1 helicase C-terminal domain-containing protein [Planctomycetota bacterium]MDP6989178.1 helicase C-terminal domain-containing protein [Planctomycetota bacterium]
MSSRREEPVRTPWDAAGEGDAQALCVLWSTGPDTAIDGVFRIQAVRRGAGGRGWDRFDRTCDPSTAPARATGAETGAATARMVREFGVDSRKLEASPRAEEAFAELVGFLGDRPLIVDDGESFDAWWRRLAAPSASQPQRVGLTELAALLLPGRLAGRREGLIADLCPPGVTATLPSTRAVGPEHLQAALRELVGRFLGQDSGTLALAAAGYRAAWWHLQAVDPDAAARLALALALVERPGMWSGNMDGELPLGTALAEGSLSGAWTEAPSLVDLVEELSPRWALEARRWGELASLPPQVEGELEFPKPDRALLDDLFRVHLPALFAERTGTEAAENFRASQHEIAERIAETLGGDGARLLLVNAPTGTGKTLAYLLPLALWARRHDLRAGISTYTRALQEQAMDREVPLALQALRRAGVESAARFCVLKGRENYLCWRALRLAVPDEDATAESWLAWTRLALFSVTDGEGDLDRLPLTEPLALADGRAFGRAAADLLRQSRARGGCCTHADDRGTCAAEVARRRAERSHVVITNHSLMLARPEFLRHVVFDECEHLHGQAQATWSHVFSLETAQELVRRLGGRGERPGLLGRLETDAPPGSRAAQTARSGTDACSAFAAAVAALAVEVEGFVRWRAGEQRGRRPADRHSLLREYAEQEAGETLIAARCALSGTGSSLESELSLLSERLDEVPTRGRARLRRRLDLIREDLHALLADAEAWLPLEGGRAHFSSQTFHDVEEEPGGAVRLAARVLLPDEYLGRFYYPQLATGLFVSATTWLKGGFEAASSYLGLDRTEHPGEDEERAPRPVSKVRSPEVFDYSRALVCVPRDAPPPNEKDAALDYIRRFVAHLAERTRGRVLVLFTNADDVRRVGARLEGFFRARHIPFWYQNMPGSAKEELGELFRRRVDSVLLGVDTFWYGADFPGETLEYLVIARLPYGVPDRYHHAQCAAIGSSEQRRRIYMPRALAKFRQGFGRLMRRVSDRGCVFLLDPRATQPRHRAFLRELPLAADAHADPDCEWVPGGARLVHADTDDCVHEALAHMGMLSDVSRRGLLDPFAPRPAPTAPHEPQRIDIPHEDVPF